ncbi:MAG: hypothetical protein EZS28_000768 [Streblomastix strix]|uniref:Uncharacterized protein n=1 Tax=Streblomastix strix TaxID=222440 RepID=A0A5J4X989_9EUKA|nr:MAG: hypothetical protein EZS28_000768 [Streblomastix strix]
MQSQIVAVSNFGGVQNGARYNAGTAGGSSTLNNGYFEERLQQYFDDPAEFESIGITQKDFPGLFFIDKAHHYHSFIQNFMINYVENYGDQQRWTIKDYAEMYARVINEVDSALNGEEQSKIKNADKLGCFSGEVEIKGWLRQTECLEKVKSNPDLIYGQRCEASKNRNSDGTRSVGKFARSADRCIFSHCRPRYSRIGKNCVKELILHEEGQDKEEIWPEILEKQYHDQVYGVTTDPIKPEEEEKQNQWKTVGIFFIIFSLLLMVALIIIVVIFILIQKSQNSKSKNVELNDQYQEPLVYQTPIPEPCQGQNLSDE